MRKLRPSGEPQAAAEGRTRRRGPSKKLDAAIAETTLRLLGSVGPGGVSIDAVAREVGCSRSSIYRRYTSKESLILAATIDRFGPRDSGAQDGRLLESVIRSRAASLRDPAFVLAWTVLMDETIRGTDLGRRYYEEAFGPLRLERAEFLSRAVANGEIRPDVDIDLLLDIVTGTLLFRAVHHPKTEADLPKRLMAILAGGVVPEDSRATANLLSGGSEEQ
jgi:AcrR family transcriptional regulator